MRNKPKTLVRVGAFNEDLGDVVNKFDENIFPIPFGLGNTVKYGLFNEKESYLLMVSQQKEKLKFRGYNVVLSITSYSEERNKQIAREFENSTGPDLNVKVPDFLKETTEFLEMGFKVFEKDPKRAMEALSKL